MSTYNEEQNQQNNSTTDTLSDSARLGKKLSEHNNSNAKNAGGIAKKGSDAVKNSGKEAAKNAGKEIAKEAGKEVGKAAARETAAAATGPVGEAVNYALKALKKVISSTEEVANAGRGNKKGNINGFLVFFAALFLTVNVFSYDQARTLVSPIVSQYSSSLFGEFSDEIFYYAADVAIEQLRKDGHVVLATLAEAGLSIYKTVKGAASKVTAFFTSLFSDDSGGDEDDGDDSIGVATDIDMDEMFKSSTDADIEVIQELGFKRAIDDAKSIAKLWIAAQPNIDIDISYSLLEEITWEEVYQDVNYAEFLSVLNENEEFSANDVTLKKFKKLFNTKQKRRALWRMRFDIEETEVEEEVYDDEGNYIGTEIKTVRYVVTTIKPYTLERLYEFVGVDDEAMHYLYTNTANIDVLDRSEEALRIYMPYYDFGSEERTPWQDDFEESDISDFFQMYVDNLITYNFGMSTEDVYSLLQDLLDGKDITDAQKAVIEAAFACIGCAYSQDYRDSEGIYDCSSLIARVYAAAGYPIASYSPTAAEECRIMESWGTTVTDYSDLQPGDIIFFSYSDNDRYKNVTHVAIYVGNGMQIDARGKNYGVVYRESQADSSAVVSICRPLAYLVDN